MVAAVIGKAGGNGVATVVRKNKGGEREREEDERGRREGEEEATTVKICAINCK